MRRVVVVAVSCLGIAGCGSTRPAEVTHIHRSHASASPEDKRRIDRMLGETIGATGKYRDVRLAVADGYRQDGPSRPGEGAHFLNRRVLAAGVFDLRRPTFLLYEHRPDWSYELVGVGWLLPKRWGDDTPPRHLEPLADWHYHEYAPPGICFWPDGTTNAVDRSACASRHGRFWRESPWMLHAWLFRPNPDGVFSLVNRTVKGIGIEPLASS